MGKRIDNDATQEVSSSMLVPPAKPPGAPSVPKNDASMWMQSPVSADDFMGSAKKPKKKAAPGEPGRRAIIAVMAVLLLVTVGLGGYWVLPARQTEKAGREDPDRDDGAAAGDTPLATTMVDAAVAVAIVEDAAVATVPADAAGPGGVAAVQADAVSGGRSGRQEGKKASHDKEENR